jgi:putative endonuclease
MRRSPGKTKSKARIKAERSGHRAELVAAWFLRLKLYRIIAKRYKTPGGEIDLIAERFGTIVFVEVKQRKRNTDEYALWASVNHARIVRASDFWISRNPTKAMTNMRFDVIFLAPGRWPRHVINAFDASKR